MWNYLNICCFWTLVFKVIDIFKLLICFILFEHLHISNTYIFRFLFFLLFYIYYPSIILYLLISLSYLVFLNFVSLLYSWLLICEKWYYVKKGYVYKYISSLCIAVVTGLPLFMTSFAKLGKGFWTRDIFIKHNY